MSEENIIKIHFAIHGFEDFVIIGGKRFDVQLYKNGCRYCDAEGIRFMEQNRAKSSVWAEKARAGALITWGMRKDAPWIYIESAARNIHEFPLGTKTRKNTIISYVNNQNL